MTEKPQEPNEAAIDRSRIPSKEEITQAVEDARRPALLLNLTKLPNDPGEPDCWMWGQPTLPPEIAWPHQEVNGLPWPLFFHAQINLARVPRRPEFPNVPETGTLFFFYDPVFSSWDSKVIYVDKDVSDVAPRPMPDPEYRPIDEWSDEDAFKIVDDYKRKRRNFDFLEIRTFEGSYNNAIYAKIRECVLNEQERVRELTKERWNFQESESRIPSLLWAHLFGVDHDPQPGVKGMLLLLRVGGVPTHDYWIDRQSLDETNFDRVISKYGGVMS